MRVLLIIMALVVTFCAGMVAGYYKRDKDHPAFCSEIEKRLFKARQKYHGMDKRAGTVWQDDKGNFYFKDHQTGRVGRFI